MGLFTYTLAGGGFFVIGTSEVLLSTSETLKVNPSPTPNKPSSPPSFSSVSFIATSVVSFFFILNSLISLIDALNSNDQTGSVLQLGVLSIASLFFLYSILGILNYTTTSLRFPDSILNLLSLFAFIEEFFLFYLQRKDPSGIENRYFDLLLVPIGVCIFSTVLELKTPKSSHSRLGRGVGLILQGMWFVQMGISFYSNLIVQGCSLHEKSRGNFTIKCKGHPEYHRGRAIATLQFNCHLALLVALMAGVYSLICKKNGVFKDSTLYKPIGAEMQPLDSHAFTLASDDDDEDNENGIKEEGNVVMSKAITVVPESTVNGYGSHH